MARALDLRIAIVSLLLLWLLCFCCSTDSAQAAFLKQIEDGGGRGEAREEHGERAAEAAQEPLVCQGDVVGRTDDEDGLHNLCPVSCFRPDPVCGEDGVTYWCGCRDARCAGVSVSHVGFCKIQNSASAEKGSQALLLLHALWLVLLGFSCLFGLL